MAFLVALLTIGLIALVVLVVGAPLRRGRLGQPGHGASLAPDDPSSTATFASHVDDLESAREAKYGEIRDAELDYRTGKLSRADYEAIDADLRAEALDILNRLESSDQPSDSGPTDNVPPGVGPEVDA
jgi:hypothetical protein